ncbi:MAG: hypothetical protein SNJ60_06170, partial [Pseudanabaenaceae cyanobacterium]
GHALADPNDPNIVYAGEYGGYLSRFDYRTRQAQNISAYPFNPSGFAPKDLKYRFQWTAPILLDRRDSKVIYHGANVLFRSKDAGYQWEIISPDLSRNDKNKQNWAGGPITGDNTGVEVYGTIFALAQGRLLGPSLWVVTEPRATAQAALAMLADPDYFQVAMANGRERMGEPGATARIVDRFLQAMGSLPRR